MVVREAAVVVTKMVVTKIVVQKKMMVQLTNFLSVLSAIILLLVNISASAAVLPEDRLDTMEHEYSGGGITVSGPSILVRKSIGSSVSVSANYYVDMISSASIDVLAQASKYSEQRIQKSVGFDYLHDRTTYNFGYITSDENDYHSKTYNFGATQTFFGDLTTLGYGMAFGQDIVGRNNKGVPDPDYKLNKQHRSYNISLSQILTKNLITDLTFESGSDACIGMKEGQSCLNNPYRSVRYLDPTNPKGYSANESEFYPLTHNMDAVGLGVMYHLPYAASLRGDLRQFTDSWGIKAHNAELRYTQTFNKDFLVEVKYRVYTQTAADFYSDLFPFKDSQNFLARDRELSTFTSNSFGVGVTYNMPWHIPFADKSTLNFYWDHVVINYDDFRDYNNFMKRKVPDTPYKPGEEPLYTLDADVLRIYMSVWF